MKLVEYVLFQRTKFIEFRGYDPDTIYLNSMFKKFEGKLFCGMQIKVSDFIDKSNALMCRNSDLIF